MIKPVFIIFGIAAISMSNVHADFFSDLTNTINNTLQNKQAPKEMAKQQAPKETVKQKAPETRAVAPFVNGSVVYKGYAREFLPVKKMIFNGRLDEAASFYEENEKNKLLAARSTSFDEEETSDEGFAQEAPQPQQIDVADEKLKFLNLLELGTLYLDSGNYNMAINKLQEAQGIIAERQNESVVSEYTANIVGGAAEILGIGEAARYEGEGFEKVLMLNLQSMGYLLKGKRDAYNVARRAMDWQRLEERKFHEDVAAVEKRIETEKKSEEEYDEDTFNLIDKYYGRYDDRANKVASAYVNPFGWYVNGIIQEYESQKDPSLWTNAIAAYKKALKLQKNNKLIKKIISRMEKRHGPKKNVNLVHIVVSDGFAPEKKVLISNIRLSSGTVKIELPIYEPVDNEVAKIVVKSKSGKTLATLSEIADIESIALRHQKDSRPMRQLTVFLSTVRGGVQSHVLSQTGLGNLFSFGAEKIQSPDTRSWMSLPARVLGTRLQLKKGVKTLQLVSYNKKGKVISRKKFSINGKKSSFIYARSIGKKVLVHVADKLWI